jgi:hypothetical protein
VIRRRLLIVLVALGLAVSSAPGVARAHPGHDQVGTAAARSAAPLAASGEPDDPPGPVASAARHTSPPSVALAAGALALLASFPHRRRTLALALTALLAIFAFEGAAHAALHLGHFRHGDGLAIGVAIAPPAVTDLHDQVRAAMPPAPREEASRQDTVRATDNTVILTQGRAPPSRQA